jgi:subtilase family serine protease
VFPTRRTGFGSSGVVSSAARSSASAAPPEVGTPAFLQQAYDLSYLSQTAGGSDTIAIVTAYDNPRAETDLATYRATYGLPTCTTANGCFRKLNQTGSATSLPSGNLTWEGETSLDVDAVSALCPNCHIILIEANSNSTSNMDAGIATAQSLGANQISNSWLETSSTPTGVGSFPGASVIAASGDAGYPGAGSDNYPAAFPGVTAAGGTTLLPANASSSLRGFNESAWSLLYGSGAASGCDLNEPKPPYQSDSGCSGRSYADVSADANPFTGLAVYDSGNGGWGTMGGTSLATPLIAAYEAVTGVSGTTAQWAYSKSALLNDPISGNTGTCASSIAYICNAGTGYDGPTGAGSISGDIVQGAPGVGGPAVGTSFNNTYTVSVSATGASLTAGVYPNGLDTHYHWQYGTSTMYGQQTTDTDIGSGAAPVSAPTRLSGLEGGSTYHYRLVAQNADGTDYGYDYTLATPAATAGAPPANTTSPTITGVSRQGLPLTVSTGSWTPAATSYAYQWQHSTDSGNTWSTITGANTSTYTPSSTDLNTTIHATITATNTGGSTTITTTAIGPITAPLPAPPANTTSPTITDTPSDPVGVLSIPPAPSNIVLSAPPLAIARPRLLGASRAVGAVVRIGPGAFGGSPLTGNRTQLMRCLRTCVAVGSAHRYRISAADTGAILRVRETAANVAGGAVVWSARSIGPVTSLSSGLAVVVNGRSALRTPRGIVLARAQVSPLGTAANTSRGRRAASAQRTIIIHRASQVRGKLRVWVCPEQAGDKPVPCTAPVHLGAAADLTVPAWMHGPVRVIVARSS